MFKTKRVYKRVFSIFNGLGIVLVVVGLLDFFLLGHNYARSQVYMAAAFVSAFVAAIVYRLKIGCVESTVSDRWRIGVDVPILVYGCAVAFILFFVLFSFTDMLSRPVVLYSCIAALAIIIGKIIFDKYKVRSNAGFKLSRIHRIGVVFAGCVLALILYLIISELPGMSTY